MTDRKAISLHDLERESSRLAAIREGNREEQADRAKQILYAHWPELFAAVGGDKSVGTTKDR